jgi:Reverse transcriptase (RNA-dependent DNA polymerase)
MFPGARQMQDIVRQNLLPNCPVGTADIAAAQDIYGPNVASIRGKTVHRSNSHIQTGVDEVPPEIMSVHREVTLAVDIMFINAIPFMVTVSRKLKFGTVHNIPDRQIPTILKSIREVISIYTARGFRVTTILADPEFSPIEHSIPGTLVDCCGENEHVPEVERYIRFIKDRVRSCNNNLPFARIPRIMLIHMVKNAVFWLNSFPAPDGVSAVLSPRYILTGRPLDYQRHVQLEFGAYAHTHDKHCNDMNSRTTSAICLGPTGNAQGTHYFLSLRTGKILRKHRWTHAPTPTDAIDRVNTLAAQQGMPTTITFADRFGREIPDGPLDVDDNHDHNYNPIDDADDASSYSGGDDDLDYDTDTDDGSDGQPPDDPPAGVDDAAPQFYEPVDEDDNAPAHDEDSDDGDEESDDGDADINNVTDDNSTEVDQNIDNNEQSDDDSTEVGDENTGVGEENTGVDEENTGVREDNTVEMDLNARYGPRSHAHNLRPRRERNFEHLFHTQEDWQQSFPKEFDEVDLCYFADSFLTEQMNVNKGLKQFGEKGADAVIEEMRQLHYRNVIKPVYRDSLTQEQRRKALRYLMFLKQKRCGKIKARGCADGRPQRLYKTKEETSAPTVKTESLFLSCLIDAMEGRVVFTLDIPGAFMHADMDELVHMKLEGPLAELLTKVDPDAYRKFVVTEKGKPVIYVELAKALYGTLQAALLFWENLSKFLVEELGFELNPYDKCVANKVINGSQCTILWHVDDLKLSHLKQEVLEMIVKKLEERYGQEKELSITRGKVHDYLGMTIDYSESGKVQFKMDDYVERLLLECPEDMNGTAVTPAADHLFKVNENNPELLSAEQADIFHHIVMQLFYLCKRVRIDIHTAVAFLTTRVTKPDKDDWNKLARVIRYLRANKDLSLTLEANPNIVLEWWVDASFAVHPDMRSHTGAVLSLGKGGVYSMSTRQKINTKSSTEAELVGVDDAMSLIIWTKNFLEAQGYHASDNVVYQDNQSAMLLERNGRASSGKRTRHVDIRYFFVTDRIQQKQMRVEYCPTEEMIADFFTKPLQGSLFRKFRTFLLNTRSTQSFPANDTKDMTVETQECVGTSSNVNDVKIVSGSSVPGVQVEENFERQQSESDGWKVVARSNREAI